MNAEHWKCPDCVTWVPALLEHRCPPPLYPTHHNHIYIAGVCYCGKRQLKEPKITSQKDA